MQIRNNIYTKLSADNKAFGSKSEMGQKELTGSKLDRLEVVAVVVVVVPVAEEEGVYTVGPVVAEEGRVNAVEVAFEEESCKE